MSTPHRCPVCNGTKSVSGGFYGLPTQSLNDMSLREPCRSCDATGIVWSPDDEPPALPPAPTGKPWRPTPDMSTRTISLGNGGTMTITSNIGAYQDGTLSLANMQGPLPAWHKDSSVDLMWGKR